MKYISLFTLLFLLVSCNQDHENLIAKNQLGQLDNTTKIHEIKSVLKSDSVELVYATTPYGKIIKSTIKRVLVYDTTGQQILNLKPSKALDSLSNISNIRILSKQYKTKNGINLGSSFADIKKYHDISNIQSSPRSIVISLKDLNASISFDRSVLPGDIQFDREAEIKPTMIPDDAKINRFWLYFSAQKDVDE